MRKKFSGYYRPTESELKAFWQDAAFVFDANILLDLYKYTPATRGSFFSVIGRLGERVWLPHQVALEFHRQRLAVIGEMEEKYQGVESVLNQAIEGLKPFKKHPHIDIDELIKMLAPAIEKAKAALQKMKDAHPDLRTKDDVLEEVTKLFDDRVGDPYPEDRLKQIYKEGEGRYAKRVPPGFMDKAKDDERKYGDLVVWFQIVDEAKRRKVPIVFVTEDAKNDWWQDLGKLKGPRAELVQEMREEADVSFQMYSSDDFLRAAQKHMPNVLEKPASEKAAAEVRAVRELSKEQREAYDDWLDSQ